MEKIFKGLGSVTGRFHNSHQEWQKAPDWVKEHYKLEEQQHCGDITSIPSGALQGAVNAVVEYARQNPDGHSDRPKCRHQERIWFSICLWISWYCQS